MRPSQPVHTQPRLPTIEILTASLEHLRRWHWDQDGLPYWRLYWNDARGASIHWEKRIDLDPGHLYLIAPQTPTRLRLTGSVGHLFVHFMVSPPFHQARDGVWTFPLATQDGRAIRALAELLVQPGPPPQASLGLMAVITRCLSLVPPADWQRQPMDGRVHQATLLIERELGRPLTVDLLAEQVGMSTAAFARLFRSNMGLSPHRYILRRRLEVSAVRLGTTDIPVKQIAESCGFCDRYHFTRVFSRHYGMGPGQFRSQRLGGGVAIDSE